MVDIPTPNDLSDRFGPVIQAPRRGMTGLGCFLYGCLGLVVFSVLGSVLGFYLVNRTINSYIKNYTDTAPMELASTTLSESEINALLDRVEEFGDSIRADEADGPLILSSDEINALIDNYEDFEDLGDAFAIELDGSRIRAQISIPLDHVEMRRLNGRYLNGWGEFTAELVDGEFVIHMVECEVNGQPLPSWLMDKLRQENLADEANYGSRQRSWIRKIESVEVINDQIIVMPKQGEILDGYEFPDRMEAPASSPGADEESETLEVQ